MLFSTYTQKYAYVIMGIEYASILGFDRQKAENSVSDDQVVTNVIF